MVEILRKIVKQKMNYYYLFFIVCNLFKLSFFSLLVGGRIEKGYNLIALGSIFIILSFSFLLKPTRSKIYLWCWSFFISALLLVNLWHLRYFQFPFSIYELFQSSNLTIGFLPSVMAQIRYMDLLFIIDLLVYPFMKFDFYIQVRNYRARLYLMSLFLIFGTALFLIKPVKVKIADQVSIPVMFKLFDRTDYIEKWSPFIYVAKDVNDVILHNNTLELTPELKNKITDWFLEHKEVYFNKAKKRQYTGIGEGKNLIVIQVESLETLTIGQKVDGKEITPNLNRLLENSFYFPNIKPQVRGGNSSDAELLTNASILPIKEGSTFFRFPENHYRSLPVILKEKGYEIAAFHGDEGSFWNRQAAYPGLGFDRYYNLSSFAKDDMVGMGLSDISFFKQSLEIIKKNHQPFYNFLITLTSHTPFDLPENLRELNLDHSFQESYIQSVHYTDKAIGMFIQGLSEQGILENTVVMIYGDHTALTPDERKDTDLPFIGQTGHIPLIIYNPSFQAAEIKEEGTQVDFLPTIANLMGVKRHKYGYTSMGQDLLNRGPALTKEQQDEAELIADYALRTDYFGNRENRVSKNYNRVNRTKS